MKKKIGVVSLGCPKNLVDSEIMLGILDRENYEIVNDESKAEVIIVNTCGFIETARQESINTILEMAELKKKHCELLIVTGCLAERYRHEIINQIPEVDAVLGTGSYHEIAGVIEKACGGAKLELYGSLAGTGYLDSDRVISTGKGYAYLKIAEGCDNCCTYCVIPSLRGRFRSRRMEDLLREAASLAFKGVKELILIAQDTTRYGKDIYNEGKLIELIRKLSEIKGIEWIRLLYCYPEEIDDALIDEIASNKKLCKYLDIPVQHSSEKILRSMGRRGTSHETAQLLDRIRERIPDVTLRTSLIVGFPGENEKEFANLLAFVEKYRFDRLGVFMYSREEGTPAATMKNQVPEKTSSKRHEAIMALQQRISEEKNRERLGGNYRVLVEGISEDGIFYYGRSYAEAPDIDGTIYFTSGEPLEIGKFTEVGILNAEQYDLIGEVKR